MDLYKIIMIGLCGAILALLIKQHRPEIAIVISLATGAIVLGLLLDKFAQIINYLSNLSASYGINSEYIMIAIKATCLAFLCDFAVSLCKDAEQNAIASKVELAGKVVLVSMALPIVTNLLKLVTGLVTP